MRMLKKIILLTAIVVSLPLVAKGFCLWGNKEHRGKLIDADTLEPIEGAVVVATWYKGWPGIGAGPVSEFHMAKEVLTDKNGEWKICGPIGRTFTEENEWTEIFYLIPFINYTKKPQFIFFKPGYQDDGEGMFSAHAYRDEKRGMEGIVLARPGDTKEEVKKYLEEHKYDMLFLPIKDPEAVLKSNSFSYRYTDDYIEIPLRILEYDYSVLALKKAVTLDDRMRARPSWPYRKRMPLMEELVKKDREEVRKWRENK